VYRSLFETVALKPKKKHFKKITEHLFERNKNKSEEEIAAAVPGDLIDTMVTLGIQQ
jgi:hypothetical protein